MAGIKYNPLINGVAYDWSNIIINVLGRTVIGVTKIAYEETQDMENNYGAGVRPISRGYGNIVATASITLTAEELIALNEVAGGTLQDIPEFDITVQYTSNPANIVTDVIKNCRFTQNMRDVSQNDMQVESEIELITSSIEWNV